MSSARIEDIIITDVEKRKSPSKHYAYIINVTRSDGATVVIGRRYSDFFDLQMSLLERFPIEGGQNDPEARVIPFLPGKIFFGRSNTREVALRRKQPIGEYCTGITKLPKHIVDSDIVQSFFKQWSEDKIGIKGSKVTTKDETPAKKTANQITGPLVLDKYVAIAEYKKEDKKQLNLKEGEVVEVAEKKENGWWLAANEEGMNGWVPGVFLEPLYGENTSPVKVKRRKPGEGESFVGIADYTATSSDELSFQEGDVLEVLEKNMEGWWYAKGGDGEGWVPTTYLEKYVGGSATSYTNENKDKKKDSFQTAKRPPPKRSTVRRTLTKAAVEKVQKDFSAKMLSKQASMDDDEEEFAGIYTTVSDFSATIEDGISFGKDETVYVTQKSSAGWWYGRVGNQRGWIPETYLKEQSKTPPIGLSPEKKPAKTGFPPLPPRGNNQAVNGGSSSPKAKTDWRPPRPPKSPQKQPVAREREPLAPKSPFKSNLPKNQMLGSPTKFGRLPDSKPANSGPPVPGFPTPKKITTKEAPLTEYNWYRDITRQEAESALEVEAEEGFFIVRPSQRGAKQGKPYSLTLFHRGICWNFHIRRRNNDQKYAVGVYKDSEPCFPTLPKLVEYYAEIPMIIGDEESKVKLVDTPQDFYDKC